MAEPDLTALHAEVNAIRRDLSNLRGTRTGAILLAQGVLTAPVGGSARTERGSDGQLHFYRSGGKTFLQVYDGEAGAWVKVELS